MISFHWIDNGSCPTTSAFRQGRGGPGVRIGFASALGAAVIDCEGCLDALSVRFHQASISQAFRNRAATESRTFLPKEGARMPARYIQALAQLVKQYHMAEKAKAVMIDDRMTRSQRSRYGREPEGKVIEFPRPK